MPTTKRGWVDEVPCQARQTSDQMTCICGNVWDMNDPEPPTCRKLTGAYVHGELIGYIRRSALERMKNDELGIRANIIKEPRYQDCVALYTAPQPTEQREPGASAPVAAQQRFRRTQKSTRDWSVWQPASINLDRPSWEIDSQGYEVEYRLLYDAPQPAEPDEERLAMEAVMESVDPATWPGLTPAQRCALGRFAKPQSAEQQPSPGAARLNRLLDEVCAAAEFFQNVKAASESGEDCTATGAWRDANEWLKSAALALVAHRKQGGEV